MDQQKWSAPKLEVLSTKKTANAGGDFLDTTFQGGQFPSGTITPVS